MIRRRLLLTGLLTAGLLLHASDGWARGPESGARLDAHLDQLIKGDTTPGVAVLILQDGQPVYSRVAGVRDPESNDPLAGDDLFRVASMTKPVTSVAAMILVEEGRLGLDDPVSQYLPAFGALEVLQPDGSRVPAERAPSIRELMTHTAGFSYNFINRPGIVQAYREAAVVDGLSDPEVTLDEAMRRLASAPLAFQPGREWHYSLGTDVLGAVVTAVSGRPLDAFIAERIADPLGLESWSFRVDPGMRDRMVRVTAPSDSSGTRLVASPDPVPFPATKGTALLDPERAFSETAYPSGGAGMTSTIADYARFLQMLANGGELDGVRVLQAESVAAMTSNQTGTLPVALRGPGWSYGLGFAILEDATAAKVDLPEGLYNWGGIYGTGFWVDPSNDTVGVVMTQTSIIGSGPITNGIREVWYAGQ